MITLLAALVVAAAPKTEIFVHVMPWFGSKERRGAWGWHWTMGSQNPDVKPASHYRPLIGLYDSGDPDVIQCQVMQMKLAGIDGILIDWYGDRDLNDYKFNDTNAHLIAETAVKFGLKVGLVYEDQTVSQLISHKVFTAQDAVAEGRSLMTRSETLWFEKPGYAKWNGRPLLLVFGPQFYKPEDWDQIVGGAKVPPALVTLQRPVGPAVGGYSWPWPKDGDKGCDADVEAYYARANAWKINIPCAYPRFHDFYSEAGVHASWGEVMDHDGRTYQRTLERALRAKQPFIQLVTWNDWGEGTQIEPSVEFGYRDLETTQRLRRDFIDPAFSVKPSDLRLPAEWLSRTKAAPDGVERQELAAIADLIAKGKLVQARERLRRRESRVRTRLLSDQR